MSMFKRIPFAYHYTVDAFGCDPDDIRSVENVRAFFRALAEAIDMQIYESKHLCMQVELYGNSPANYGVTGLCPILTSSFTVHTVLKTRAVYLDVLSCQPFCNFKVDDVVERFFRPTVPLKTHMRAR